MTDKQLQLYFREWRAASAALKALGHAGDDYQRKALQADAIGGIEKSAKDLTNAELTKVLAKFRSYSQPADLGAQLKAEDEPAQRRAATLAEIVRLAAARGVNGGVPAVSRYFHKFLADQPLDKVSDDKLRRLLWVLKNRPAKAPATPAQAARPAPATPVSTPVPTPSAAPAQEGLEGWDGEI